MAACCAGVAAGSAAPAGSFRSVDPVITSVYPVAHPRGLLVTTGGWAYCLQVQSLARVEGYTLLCGRYSSDGYTGPGLRPQRHLDWGNPSYLASFARSITALHRRVGGSLVLIGVSYSGYGVAVLASQHPELRPTRLIVIDSFLDLVARRSRLPATHETAREIDAETGGSPTALAKRSVSPEGLAALLRSGTRLTVIWSVSAEEKRYFNGATCDRTANAATIAATAQLLDRPITVWVTQSRHGQDLWHWGKRIMDGQSPGLPVVIPASGEIPVTAICA